MHARCQSRHSPHAAAAYTPPLPPPPAPRAPPTASVQTSRCVRPFTSTSLWPQRRTRCLPGACDTTTTNNSPRVDLAPSQPRRHPLAPRNAPQHLNSGSSWQARSRLTREPCGSRVNHGVRGCQQSPSVASLELDTVIRNCMSNRMAVDAEFQGLTLLPISAQLEAFLPLSAQVKLTLFPMSS